MSEDQKVIVKIRDLTLGIYDEHGNRSQRIQYGSFDICDGDFIIVRGRNGSGKSTLFHLLTLYDINYFRMENGDVFYNVEGLPEIGIDQYTDADAAALRRDIVYISQEEIFHTGHSGYEALCSPAYNALKEQYKYLPQERTKKLAEVRALVEDYFEKYIRKSFKCKELKDFMKKKVTAYSGGQMKMLNVLAGLIKAEVCGSPLIIMDEPLNNLDGRNKYYLNEVIKRIREQNVAILIITHCQIFDGINRVMMLEAVDQKIGEFKAIVEDKTDPPHDECLENYTG